MADVKWIKLATDIFDNRKIKAIEQMPDGDAIIVVWLKILTLAGTVNDGGSVYFTRDIPYSDQLLSAQFNRPLSLIQLALSTFEKFGMIEIVDDIIHVSNWEKYQNVESLDMIREQTRKRVAKYREKQKMLKDNEPCNVTVTLRNAIEEDKDKEEDKNKIYKNTSYSLSTSVDPAPKTSAADIVNLYHAICKSYPKVRALSDSRRKAISARLRTHSMDEIREVFEKAERSSFLKGSNKRNWSANFDWLMNDANFFKVLDGNYDDKRQSKDSQASYDLDEYEKFAKNYDFSNEEWNKKEATK